MVASLKKSEEKVQELERRLAEQEEEKNWREKMKKERVALEQKVQEFQVKVEELKVILFLHFYMLSVSFNVFLPLAIYSLYIPLSVSYFIHIS